VEMGMNAPGEIAYLAGLAEPDLGVITCIAPVHLEGLGTLEAVAAAKGELLQALGPLAQAVIPGDEPLLTPYLEPLAPNRRIRFGFGVKDEVRLLAIQRRGAAGSELSLSLRGKEISFHLPLVGEHNARNAAAAAAVGMSLRIPPEIISRGLSRVPELHHRSRLRRIGDWNILDDCYNANPVAMRAALDALAQLAQGNETVAVLGCMLELGPEAERYHREVGRYAAGTGVSLLITVGELGSEIAKGALEAGMDRARVLEADGIREAKQVLVERASRAGHASQTGHSTQAGHASREGWLLVKGSRGAHLEELLEELEREMPAEPPTACAARRRESGS
jgi:UDP-N-acetylmuramyl pentapeptide synthase